MEKKKIIIISTTIILVILIAILTIFLINKQNEEKAKQALIDFVGLINEKDYEKMYEKTISMNMSKEDFIARNKNIYEGIDCADIKIGIQNIEKQDGKYEIQYTQQMYTSAGEINFTNTAHIERENKEYKVKWSSQMIFPQLGSTDKVRVSNLKAKRGDILDRNGNKLAQDGYIASVGIVPGKLGDNKEENISKISELTGVSTEYINKQLDASYVKEDTFVPVKKIKDTDINLKEQLLQIPGILINKVEARVYPLGEDTGHLIGYVQAINKEELEANSGKGYNTNSIIGKSGLEKAYEDILRGFDGTEIYITDEDGNKKTTLSKQDKKDGKDVKLTIDSKLQSQIYQQMKNDKGFFVVMQPKTGEMLALVSTPTYDSNDFVVGMTQEQWDKLNNDSNKPLYNRFIQKYCPGSTFKPITGAIGLTTGKITANEDFGYTGTSWQKDSGWGTYKVTTLTGYQGPKNLANALLYSDNIYFAQSALKIGADTFAQNLDKLGFNEQIEFPFKFSKITIC